MINQMMINLIDDALFCLNSKVIYDKKKIHSLMRSLHNLPMYYLKQDQSVNGSRRNPISKDDALAASFNLVNMGEGTRI